jgi:hypothetical protein
VNIVRVSKMGDVPVLGYQTLWTNKLSALKSEFQTLMQHYPEADAQLKLRMWQDIPTSIGESSEWAVIVNAAEDNGASYCKGLHGKPLLVPCLTLIQ